MLPAWALAAALCLANPAFAEATAPTDAGGKPLPSPRQLVEANYSATEIEDGVYVGSELCLACHKRYRGWKETRHSLSIRRPVPRYSLLPGKGVVADADGNGVDDFIQGLDFNTISSAFDAFKPAAPILFVVDGKYFIRIGKVQMPVVFVLGGTGSWRERYGVRIPAADSPTGYSDEVYISPVQFNEQSRRYVAYKANHWYDADNHPRIKPGLSRADLAVAVKSATSSKNCVGCHITGIRSVGKTAQGEWLLHPYPALRFDADDPAYFDYDGDGRVDLMNIGCEMCHGPGSAHILDRHHARIFNPAKASTAQANEVCGRCHNRVRSTPNKTYGFAYHDDTGKEWRPGKEPLADYTIDNNAFWPDGETSWEHNQHYSENRDSAHAGLRCTACHDPHAPANPAQIVSHRTVAGVDIPTRFEDNSLCLSCHAGRSPFQGISMQMIAKPAEEPQATRRPRLGESSEASGTRGDALDPRRRAQPPSAQRAGAGKRDSLNAATIGAVVSAHSHHPYAPERDMGLSRCTTCHMPAVAGAQHESPLHTHQVRVIPPEKTLAYQAKGGMPNACAASCHGSRVDLWGFGVDTNPTNWNEPVDIQTATRLMEYFGPGGEWWRTGDASGSEPPAR